MTAAASTITAAKKLWFDKWKYDKNSMIQYCTGCHQWTQWTLTSYRQQLDFIINKQFIDHCLNCGLKGHLILRNREEHYPHIVFLEQGFEL
jgi:hypothetical protein